MSEEDRFWFEDVKYRILEGKDGVREAYDSMASSYDCSKFLYWTRKMEEAEERIVKRWLCHFSGVCLDVGCGTGKYALKISEEGVEVVALDLSSSMLERLKWKAKKGESYGRINIVIGDGEHLPFRKDSFDSLASAGPVIPTLLL